MMRREFIMLLGGTGSRRTHRERTRAECMWGAPRIGCIDAAKPRQTEERMVARWLILCAAIAAGVLGVTPKLAAQGYPQKPIKLIVPFPPGGPIDTMARFMTQALGTRLSQSIVIENRPGGGATIATRFVAASPPDGYTQLFGSSGSLAVAPALYSNLDYDPVASFEPVAQVAIMQQLMVIRSDIPANTLAEFVDYAKARPGKLSYGAALATPPHLMSTMFKVKAGIDSLYVPYKGSASSVTDLLAVRQRRTAAGACGREHGAVERDAANSDHARRGFSRCHPQCLGRRGCTRRHRARHREQAQCAHQ
jgi:hypothetical protein